MLATMPATLSATMSATMPATMCNNMSVKNKMGGGGVIKDDCCTEMFMFNGDSKVWWTVRLTDGRNKGWTEQRTDGRTWVGARDTCVSKKACFWKGNKKGLKWLGAPFKSKFSVTWSNIDQFSGLRGVFVNLLYSQRMESLWEGLDVTPW